MKISSMQHVVMVIFAFLLVQPTVLGPRPLFTVALIRQLEQISLFSFQTSMRGIHALLMLKFEHFVLDTFTPQGYDAQLTKPLTGKGLLNFVMLLPNFPLVLGQQKPSNFSFANSHYLACVATRHVR